MTGDGFFDTNVLLYAFSLRTSSQSDSRTQKALEALGHGGIVSVQILTEFTDVAAKKWKMSWHTIGQCLDEIRVVCGRPVPITADTHASAVTISMRYGFRIYDSLIVASALEAGCTTLYTEDLQHGQVIERLRIENPFRDLN